MSSSIVSSPTLVTSQLNRRSANFHPSIWGDRFLSYTSDIVEETHDREEHEKLKEEVKRMLMINVNKSSQLLLDFVDAIQRLGVSYHFENEIDEILREMYKSPCDSDQNSHDDDDLYTTSLRFRLLRQQGYKISSDLFNKFKNSQGNFNNSLVADSRGLLNLYEATHLRVHGDNILEEALAFTTTHLESLVTNLQSPLREKISHALKQPIRKGLPRVEARHYFSIYQEDPSHDEVLLKFAKLDFNILQKLHQKELSEITKWWKDLDFANKLSFVRDRVVECYFWILGVYFEPEYILARKITTKVIAITSIIDDIYDVYGTPEELELFTAAIERWDISALDQLPDYMKIAYTSLLDVYAEIEKATIVEGRLYRFHYAKEAMKNQVQDYFLESKWFHQQYIPTMEEYMPLALATTGYSLLTTTSLVGMGDIVTKDSFDWLSSKPKILKSSQIICRLMDDIVSHKFEQERGHVASSIECYMKQYGVTDQEAVHEFREQITNSWKDINEDCLHPTSAPMPILTRILNFSRVMDVLYKDGDGYTNSGSVLKDFISSLLIDPVPMESDSG